MIDFDAKVKSAHAMMDLAIEIFKPVAVYGLFSGGHDSLTATHIASLHPAFTAAAHINTGIGIKETRQFVRDTCEEHGWDLEMVRAKEDCGQDFREIVMENGFPGPAAHGLMYNMLKERGLRVLLKRAKTGKHRLDPVMLISGVRSAESERRMRHVDPLQKEGSKLWTAIIHDWTKMDCNKYIEHVGLKRNMVVDTIHKSGECLCGAYAKKGELAELEMWYPETAAEIRQLERDAKAAGHDWKWEDRPPKKSRKKKSEPVNMMCVGCDKPEDDLGDLI